MCQFRHRICIPVSKWTISWSVIDTNWRAYYARGRICASQLQISCQKQRINELNGRFYAKNGRFNGTNVSTLYCTKGGDFCSELAIFRAVLNRWVTKGAQNIQFRGNSVFLGKCIFWQRSTITHSGARNGKEKLM